MSVALVMTSHDACTNGTSRVLTLTSLQRAAAVEIGGSNFSCRRDGEVRSAIKFLNAQSTAPIEIHRVGLIFRDFRVKIPVSTIPIEVLFAFSLSHQGKCSIGFTLPLSI